MQEELLKQIVTEIEMHNPAGIMHCLENGLSPDTSYHGKTLLMELVSEYTRSTRFTSCVRALSKAGLQHPDPSLQAVLMDDASALQQEIQKDIGVISRRYTLPCAYTPLFDITLLHICAEFNLINCGTLLIVSGADTNAPAGIDVHELGGQTPIFHTVNQNSHQSAAMMQLLLDNGASIDVTVRGILWGKGYPWETLIPAVNPISYAMMGLLPQMHRDEQVIAQVVQLLMRHKTGISLPLFNVPNRYLTS